MLHESHENMTWAALLHRINCQICQASGGERFYLPARDMPQIRDVVEAMATWPAHGHHMAICVVTPETPVAMIAFILIVWICLDH